MFKGTFQTLQSTTGLAAVGTECGPLYLLTLGGNLEVGQPAAKKCDALTGVPGNTVVHFLSCHCLCRRWPLASSFIPLVNQIK